MGDVEDVAGQTPNEGVPGMQPVQSAFPTQHNNLPMQAAMGPQGGGMPGPAAAAGQQGPQGLPQGMMTGPQEWEWLTMSL